MKNENRLPIMIAVAVLTSGMLTTAVSTPLAAQVRGEVRGRIISTVSGQPIGDASVSSGSSGAQVRSDAQGEYLIRGLEPGRTVLVFRAIGFESRSLEVMVSNARTATLDVSLAPSAPTLARILVQAVRDTAAPNAVVFNRDAIEASGQRDLADLLQSASAVVITRRGGPGQPATVSIRGSSASQVLVLVDGVPLNSELGGSADLSAIPLESIESVTVLTGSQSARYGARAMAGVIEITSRKARDERSALLRTGALGEWELGGNYGTTFGSSSILESTNLTINHSSTRGNFAYEVPALRGGGQARRQNADARSTQMLAGVGLTPGAVKLALRSSVGITDRGMAGSIVQPSLSGGQHFMRWNGGGTANFDLGRWMVTTSADATREGARLGDPTPPFGESYADTVVASSVSLASSTTAHWNHVTTSAGIDFRQLHLSSNNLDESAPLTQNQSGLWLSARSNPIAVGAASQPSVNGAGSAGLQLTSEITARVDHSSLLRETLFSPRLSLRLEKDRLAFSASYGSGFTPPSIADQFFHEGVQVKANPDLRPERTRHDMEARIAVRDAQAGSVIFAAEGAVFRSDIQDMILWFPDFRFIWSPHNYDVTRRGWEMRGQLLIPALHLDLQGSVDEVEVTYAGPVLDGQVTYRPRRTASLVSAFSAVHSRLEVSSRYTGSRRTAPGTNLNSLPAYNVTDLRFQTTGTWKAWSFTPTISVENIFNRHAAMLMDYPFPAHLWSISLRIRSSSSPNL